MAKGRRRRVGREPARWEAEEKSWDLAGGEEREKMRPRKLR